MNSLTWLPPWTTGAPSISTAPPVYQGVPNNANNHVGATSAPLAEIIVTFGSLSEMLDPGFTTPSGASTTPLRDYLMDLIQTGEFVPGEAGKVTVEMAVNEDRIVSKQALLVKFVQEHVMRQ